MSFKYFHSNHHIATAAPYFRWNGLMYLLIIVKHVKSIICLGFSMTKSGSIPRYVLHFISQWRKIFESTVKGPDHTTFDFIGFQKLKRIIEIIVVFMTKFAYILINSHKILIKHIKISQNKSKYLKTLDSNFL